MKAEADIPMFFAKNLSRFFVIMILLMFVSHTQAQDSYQDKVRKTQRAIFIFNFSQQVSWPNMANINTFRIGVLGADPTHSDLSDLGQKRRIQGKPVEVVRFQFLHEVKDVQVLYVNNKYNFDIHHLLSKVSGKNILLITEDYNFNASMINMVSVGDSFEYEINQNKIEKEGFVIVSTLRSNSITSSEKWKQLYKKAEKNLQEAIEDKNEKEEVLASKKVEIEDQKRRIQNQKVELDERDKKIKVLFNKEEIQKKKYEEKVAIEKELEENIQKQIQIIKSQEGKINKTNELIESQLKVLDEQNKKIEEQQNVLTERSITINSQKKINLLLLIIIILVAMGSVFIYTNYLRKNRINKELALKNNEISSQAKELESKNKELEQFAYIASHDLQEPLNTISSFIGLIEEEYEEHFDEMGKESMAFIKEASGRMKKLIHALLQYSRLGREKELEKVDCDLVLENIKKDLGEVLQKTKAIINVDQLPVLNGVEVELRLLFQNLISNGIKFRRKDTVPLIHVTARRLYEENNNRGKGVWEFAIKDNGIGIAKEHQDRIFAIFKRLHSREEYEGTGIGLAHCKKIVESHGGTIWLTSEPNEGSVFYFTIPF